MSAQNDGSEKPGYKRSNTGLSVQSVEELKLAEDAPKHDADSDEFKMPGTNAALRRASTTGLTVGPPGGPPNIKRLSCVDEDQPRPKLKRTDTGFSLLSLEEVELQDEPKKLENFNDGFRQPGTNIALRRASTVRFADGTKAGAPEKGGPPQIKRMNCIDEKPKETKWQGLVKGFRNFWNFKNNTSKVQEIKV